ncbi:hypothetical protein TURU_158573 [Turdus rufiventris]|nr:hypothetical protein TURU_158573 [Turdus rufiventris]
MAGGLAGGMEKGLPVGTHSKQSVPVPVRMVKWTAAGNLGAAAGTADAGTEPDSPVGEVLLKTQFVAKSWEDIRRILKKIEGLQEKGLQDLLREAQRVYMRREEEQQKAQAKVLVAAVKEAQRQERVQDNVEPTLNHQPQKKQNPPQKKQMDNHREAPECFYCEKKGHFKRQCTKRMRDEKIFQED